MSSQMGNKIKVSIFGESHGAGIGAVIDCPPAGIQINKEYIKAQALRRAPGKDKTSTPRKEADEARFISGVKNGYTTGAPLTLLIENTNTRSTDYGNLSVMPRPSHSDYAAYVKYNGFNDISGGGHFSGRLTAPLVAAASVFRPHLEQMGVFIGGHVLKIGTATDTYFDPVNVSNEQLKQLSGEYFAVIDSIAKQNMAKQIEKVRLANDSIGGIVELAVTGIPTGLGDPMFDGIENILSRAIFGVPAVKGIEFGDGFEYAEKTGSTANDQMQITNGEVSCTTNHCGGITGGITNGMPIIIRVALKPTPSIGIAQKTVDLKTGENTELLVKGRHDPCIVPRALPAIEAAITLAIADLML